MTAVEAIEYIENYTWSATRLGLERTRELLHRMGDPQKKLRFIHVAGSNGKGSTCAMIDAILRQAGYRTGLYTSPYIQDLCERIQVNGENIPGDTLAAVTERVREMAEKMSDHPSQFELVTAIAMQYFADARCDIVVLEVGMGGELDSTNVIDAPEAAVITNIGLEHTEYLGDTLQKIAATKAGIIKPGCDCVCYEGADEVTEVIKTVCAEKGVPLACADFSHLKSLSSDLDGQEFAYLRKDYRLTFLSRHQLYNAATVLEAVDVLRKRGWSITAEAVREGLASVKWPARMEILNRAPLLILDGGHNPQCAEALADSLKELLPGQKAVFLIGVLADKDYPKMIEAVLHLASEFVCVTPLSDRALSAEKLAEYLTKNGTKATACVNAESGIKTALSAAGEDGAVVAFGSLYLAGGVRTAFRPAYRKWLRREKIRARDALSKEERDMLSEKICSRILSSEEFQSAGTVMIYRATRGEVRLDALEASPEAKRKRLVFPLCVSETEMIALLPKGEDAWKAGYYGISEPVLEKSRLIPPEDIDLVICPCTAFDKDGNRMGMGAGFYDRYLPKCKNAHVAAVAFECQKTDSVPKDAWDKSMDLIFSEKMVYRGNA